MKRIVRVLSTLLFVVMFSAVGAPNAFASTLPGVPEDLSDAYISFSESLEERGVTVQTPLEDFIDGFNSSDGLTIDEYSSRLIDEEVAASGITDSLISNNEAIAEEYIAEHGQAAGESPETRSSGGAWYDYIGKQSVSLPQKADYSRYNILSTVQKGDVVSETKGLVASITGHIAIVEGKFWDSAHSQYYIRTVEANGEGVVRGVLDDDRKDERGTNIYYVRTASSSQKNGAVSFCIGQIGKPYSLEFPLTQCSYSSSTSNWYCSELVWAAYYNQGINFNGSSIPMNIYLPRDLAASSHLTKRSIY